MLPYYHRKRANPHIHECLFHWRGLATRSALPLALLNGVGSKRTLVGLAIWPALFLVAFAAYLRFLPSRPLMTVTPPEGVSVASFSPDSSLLMTQSLAGRRHHSAGRLRFWEISSGPERFFPMAGYEKADPHFEYSAEFITDETLLLRRCVEAQKRWSLKVVELESRALLLDIDSAYGCPGYLSADKRTLATFSRDLTDPHAEIWDIPNCRKATPGVGRGAGPCLNTGNHLAFSYASTVSALWSNLLDEQNGSRNTAEE
jgi:hypothetical protein